MPFQYDIAVSFAGEDRKLVEPVAIGLHKKGVQVFYDLLEQANLWGKDLYQYLADIYSTKSKYCIIFVSKYYIEKKWTKHELRSVQFRAFEQDIEYILPIRLDNTKLPGLPDTIGYLDANTISTGEIIELVLKKIGKENVESNKKNNILFWKIRSVVNANDPIELLSIGKNSPFESPPSDEYDPEISKIYDLLPVTQSPDELAYNIKNVFAKFFNEEMAGSVDKYIQMAYEIWELRDRETFDKLYNYGYKE